MSALRKTNEMGMGEPKLQITRRRLPHWTLSGSVYFVTFRVATGILSEDERRVVLDHVCQGQGRFYELGSLVVMPDHVHLILKPYSDFPISRVMKGIKGATARKVNAMRGSLGQIWQMESWDRIMRDDAELQTKLQYMLDNPVKADLAKTIEQYDAWYLNPTFCG